MFVDHADDTLLTEEEVNVVVEKLKGSHITADDDMMYTLFINPISMWKLRNPTPRTKRRRSRWRGRLKEYVWRISRGVKLSKEESVHADE